MKKSSETPQEKKESRRNFLSNLAMLTGLVLSYGALTIKGLLFIIPPNSQVKRRKIYAGRLDEYSLGTIQKFFDLEGKEILVKRSNEGIKAFSSVCPHLGCRVHWQPENKTFFCPCHGGEFDADGAPIAGPPKDGNTPLFEVPVHVDESSGIVYLQVKDTSGGLS